MMADEESSNGMFAYQDAGRDAPELVQQAIDDFHNLPSYIKNKKPLLYWLLGSGTPPYKMAPEDVEYTPMHDTEAMCHNCEFMYMKMSNGSKICSQILGNVSPSCWSNQWVNGKKDM